MALFSHKTPPLLPLVTSEGEWYNECMKCLLCGGKTYKNRSKYCDNKCQTKHWKLNNRKVYLAGKKRYREKNIGKIREYNKEIKQFGIPYMKRQEALLENPFCVRCNSTEKLNAHHIMPVKLRGDHELNNIIIFCWDCHMLWHKLIKGFWY